MRGCVCQVESMRPSGASNEDIVSKIIKNTFLIIFNLIKNYLYMLPLFLQIKQAQILLPDDPKYQKGFKFDHVWHILKDCEKFATPNATSNVQRPT